MLSVSLPVETYTSRETSFTCSSPSPPALTSSVSLWVLDQLLYTGMVTHTLCVHVSVYVYVCVHNELKRVPLLMAFMFCLVLPWLYLAN